MQLLGAAVTDDQFEEPWIYRHCQHAATWDTLLNSKFVDIFRLIQLTNLVENTMG
jgi:hypothetical protein